MFNRINGKGRHGRIERLCGELGWSIDGRDRDTITLDFNDPVTSRRSVYIASGDESLVLFTTFSMAIVSATDVPDGIPAYLLLQNSKQGAGMWQMTHDDTSVYFSLIYRALGDGLNAGALKFICQGMVREAAQFDERMLKAGYLRQ